MSILATSTRAHSFVFYEKHEDRKSRRTRSETVAQLIGRQLPIDSLTSSPRLEDSIQNERMLMIIASQNGSRKEIEGMNSSDKLRICLVCRSYMLPDADVCLICKRGRSIVIPTSIPSHTPAPGFSSALFARKM